VHAHQAACLAVETEREAEWRADEEVNPQHLGGAEGPAIGDPDVGSLGSPSAG